MCNNVFLSESITRTSRVTKTWKTLKEILPGAGVPLISQDFPSVHASDQNRNPHRKVQETADTINVIKR